MSAADITHRFTFHIATADKHEQHESVRDACKTLALLLDEHLPESREKALAITHLETVMFWSNASVARQAER
ncbi:hypothetical protein [Nocardia terpenica]|uniref:Acb2/Tad1 hairpin domain-containing protein n=1 Tax=Nocardia terpenica TaxID=455432 RepID=A0A164PLT3_9NOCA|nr:hypothetical protein [Nocardia terpenica]KZM75738.1 hypothetical protein AWN90_20590 [Nocardia terpenica]NQE86252.1 hypothetical protein [Nocardia terpenica]